MYDGWLTSPIHEQIHGPRESIAAGPENMQPPKSPNMMAAGMSSNAALDLIPTPKTISNVHILTLQ